MTLLRFLISVFTTTHRVLIIAASALAPPLGKAYRSVGLFMILTAAAISVAQGQHANPLRDLTPYPAQSAVLAAFDKYEVVGMPEAHGLKDLDDFILALVRSPRFSNRVNYIVVECGNSLYQPILDRYIAGDDVPLSDVRQVWRNTTQIMCGHSGFFEQFFPLIRAINQTLPPKQRIRVLGGDPPVDWNQIKSFQDVLRLPHRDANIAAVMEQEVLSKHRKALMLFGTFHLFHNVEHSAVSIYEKKYPHVTYVISDLALFDAQNQRHENPFTEWPVPSLAAVEGTWLGALNLEHLLPALTLIDKDCNVRHDFPKELQQPIGNLVDAVLYLGPPELLLNEQFPADTALDTKYRTELQRRQGLPGIPAAPRTIEQENAEIIKQDSNPLFLSSVPMPADASHPDPALRRAVQECRDAIHQ